MEGRTEVRRRWNRGGNEVEPRWNRGGTEQEPKWNRGGTEVEPRWNRSGTEVEPTWNRGGTEVEPSSNLYRSYRSRITVELLFRIFYVWVFFNFFFNLSDPTDSACEDFTLAGLWAWCWAHSYAALYARAAPTPKKSIHNLSGPRSHLSPPCCGGSVYRSNDRHTYEECSILVRNPSHEMLQS